MATTTGFLRPAALVILLLLLCGHGPAGARAQEAPTATARTLEEALELSFMPATPAILSLFPAATLLAQTPIQVHVAMVTSLAQREAYAACHPAALSFFGTKDRIPPAMCKQPEFSLTFSYTIHRVVSDLYPIAGRSYATYLTAVGLTPNTPSSDISTPLGWGNVIGARMSNYFANDGWNVLGTSDRIFFPKRFADTTGYQPVNHPYVEPNATRFPLRWTPLTQAYDNNGNYASQVHVTPQLAKKVRPFTMSDSAFAKKRVPKLYENPSSHRYIKPADKKLAKKLIRKLLARSSAMTTRRLGMAAWWDFKPSSLGSFLVFYTDKLRIPKQKEVSLIGSEMLAQHDATVLAWREKVRHDLVRPETLLRLLQPGGSVRAWRGLRAGVGKIDVEDWQPAVRTMPHSEYPSLSAMVCTATLQHLQTALKDFLPDNSTIPPYAVPSAGENIPGFPLPAPFPVRFDNLAQAARDCGRSRLNAGLHFVPAVLQGEIAAQGIGEAAFRTMADLDNGVVPSHCHWCI